MVEAYKSGQKLEQSAPQKVTLRVNYSMYIISHTQLICTELCTEYQRQEVSATLLPTQPFLLPQTQEPRYKATLARPTCMHSLCKGLLVSLIHCSLSKTVILPLYGQIHCMYIETTHVWLRLDFNTYLCNGDTFTAYELPIKKQLIWFTVLCPYLPCCLPNNKTIHRSLLLDLRHY